VEKGEEEEDSWHSSDVRRLWRPIRDCVTSRSRLCDIPYLLQKPGWYNGPGAQHHRHDADDNDHCVKGRYHGCLHNFITCNKWITTISLQCHTNLKGLLTAVELKEDYWDQSICTRENNFWQRSISKTWKRYTTINIDHGYNLPSAIYAAAVMWQQCSHMTTESANTEEETKIIMKALPESGYQNVYVLYFLGKKPLLALDKHFLRV